MAYTLHRAIHANSDLQVGDRVIDVLTGYKESTSGNNDKPVCVSHPLWGKAIEFLADAPAFRCELKPNNLPGWALGSTQDLHPMDAANDTSWYLMARSVEVATDDTWIQNELKAGALMQAHGTENIGEEKQNPIWAFTVSETAPEKYGKFGGKGDHNQITNKSNIPTNYEFGLSDEVPSWTYARGERMYLIIAYWPSYENSSAGRVRVFYWKHGQSAPTWSNPSISRNGQNAYNDNYGPYIKFGLYASFQRTSPYGATRAHNYAGHFYYYEADGPNTNETDISAAYADCVTRLTGGTPTAAKKFKIFQNSINLNGQTYLVSDGAAKTIATNTETGLVTAKWIATDGLATDSPAETDNSSPYQYVAFTPSALSVGEHTQTLITTDDNGLDHTETATFNIENDAPLGTNAVVDDFVRGDSSLWGTAPTTVDNAFIKWYDMTHIGTNVAPSIVSNKCRFSAAGQIGMLRTATGVPKKYYVTATYNPNNGDARLGVIFGATSTPVIAAIGSDDIRGFGHLSIARVNHSTPDSIMHRFGMTIDEPDGEWEGAYRVLESLYSQAPVLTNNIKIEIWVDWNTGVFRHKVTDVGAAVTLCDESTNELAELGFKGRHFGLVAKKCPTTFDVSAFDVVVDEYYATPPSV